MNHVYWPCTGLPCFIALSSLSMWFYCLKMLDFPIVTFCFFVPLLSFGWQKGKFSFFAPLSRNFNALLAHPVPKRSQSSSKAVLQLYFYRDHCTMRKCCSWLLEPRSIFSITEQIWTVVSCICRQYQVDIKWCSRFLLWPYCFTNLQGKYISIERNSYMSFRLEIKNPSEVFLIGWSPGNLNLLVSTFSRPSRICSMSLL